MARLKRYAALSGDPRGLLEIRGQPLVDHGASQCSTDRTGRIGPVNRRSRMKELTGPKTQYLAGREHVHPPRDSRRSAAEQIRPWLRGSEDRLL